MAFYHQCVSLDGSDSNDGFSWSSPKLTIAAAVAALANGGDVYLAPTSLSADGTSRSAYAPASTITLNGHRIVGLGNTRGPSGGSAPTRRQVEIAHSFNGNLFNLVSGSVEHATLYNTGAFTGAAIYNLAAGNPNTNQNSGYIYIDDVNVSGVNGFTYDLYLDGSASTSPLGVRSVFVNNSTFFGCTTAGKTVYIDTGVHVFFSNCEVITAPEAVTQGIYIKGVGSEDINFTGCNVLGDFYSEAGGEGLSFVGGRISGTITCAASSAGNRFAPTKFGTFTNNGGATNACKQLAA